MTADCIRHSVLDIVKYVFRFRPKMAGLFRFRLFFGRKSKFIFRLFLFYGRKSKIHFRSASSFNCLKRKVGIWWSVVLLTNNLDCDRSLFDDSVLCDCLPWLVEINSHWRKLLYMYVAIGQQWRLFVVNGTALRALYVRKVVSQSPRSTDCCHTTLSLQRVMIDENKV